MIMDQLSPDDGLFEVGETVNIYVDQSHEKMDAQKSIFEVTNNDDANLLVNNV